MTLTSDQVAERFHAIALALDNPTTAPVAGVALTDLAAALAAEAGG